MFVVRDVILCNVLIHLLIYCVIYFRESLESFVRVKKRKVLFWLEGLVEEYGKLQI